MQVATPTERARRHRSVTLIGPTEAGGFARQQYLVEKDGRLVQLSDLLFLVLEAADGRRSVDEIADYVTSRSDRRVTAAHVSKLMASLRPLGLLETESTNAEVSPSSQPDRRRLGPRAKIIGSSVLGPVGRVLSYMYRLSLAAVVAGVAVIAHVWLYISGSPSLEIVLYQPGPLILVLLIIVAAAIVHEFGHVAALASAGHRPEWIAVGMYGPFPALYTDTRGAYQSTRRQRIQIDLGGVYFHVIAASGLIGLFAATGSPALWLAVLLVDVDIIRQLLPLPRLDGYWLFADVIGIPDPLRQARLLLRRETRSSLRAGAATALIIYLAITVVVTATIMVVTADQLPAVLSRLWHAMGTTVLAVPQFARAGQWAATGLSLVHALVLAFALFGLAYVIFAVVASLLRLVVMGVRHATVVK